MKTLTFLFLSFSFFFSPMVFGAGEDQRVHIGDPYETDEDEEEGDDVLVEGVKGYQIPDSVGPFSCGDLTSAVGGAVFSCLLLAPLYVMQANIFGLYPDYESPEYQLFLGSGVCFVAVVFGIAIVETSKFAGLSNCGRVRKLTKEEWGSLWKEVFLEMFSFALVVGGFYSLYYYSALAPCCGVAPAPLGNVSSNAPAKPEACCEGVREGIWPLNAGVITFSRTMSLLLRSIKPICAWCQRSALRQRIDSKARQLLISGEHPDDQQEEEGGAAEDLEKGGTEGKDDE